MTARLILTLVNGEKRVLVGSRGHSPEQALTSLGEWLKTEDGGWVQRSAIVEIEFDDGDAGLSAAAEELEVPLISDEEQAALAGERSLEAVLELDEREAGRGSPHT